MLTDNAEIWWRSAERMIDTQDYLATWDQFKERFYKKYFSSNTRFKKQAEFLSLKQGAMTVEEYEEEFNKLSHFAPEMVATEKTRVQRFVQGLKVGLRGLAYSQDPKTYDAALRAAVRIDADAR